MPWRYARSPQFYWPMGWVHKDRLADPLQCRPRKIASSCHIAYSLYRLPCPLTSHKTVARRRYKAHVLKKYRNSAYFCSLEIIKCLKYLACVSRENVLQRSHIPQMTNLSLLLTFLTILFATVMRHASHERSTYRAVSLALTNVFLIQTAVLRFTKHVWLVKYLFHFAHGILTAEKARGCLVLESPHVKSQRCVASVLHALLHALHTYFFAIASDIFTIT